MSHRASTSMERRIERHSLQPRYLLGLESSKTRLFLFDIWVMTAIATLCRIMTAIEEGEIISKSAAFTRWRDRLPALANAHRRSMAHPPTSRHPIPVSLTHCADERNAGIYRVCAYSSHRCSLLILSPRLPSCMLIQEVNLMKASSLKGVAHGRATGNNTPEHRAENHRGRFWTHRDAFLETRA